MRCAHFVWTLGPSRQGVISLSYFAVEVLSSARSCLLVLEPYRNDLRRFRNNLDQQRLRLWNLRYCLRGREHTLKLLTLRKRTSGNWSLLITARIPSANAPMARNAANRAVSKVIAVLVVPISYLRWFSLRKKNSKRQTREGQNVQRSSDQDWYQDWYHCDDRASPQRVSPAKVLAAQAYLMFYEWSIIQQLIITIRFRS